MKKNIFLLAVISLTALCACNTPKAAKDWAIDKPLKFQLAYIPDGKTPELSNPEAPTIISHNADYSPDIDNVNLADIKGLGFNLPERSNPADYKLYFKLFNFPSCLDSQALVTPLLAQFKLDKAPGNKELSDFLKDYSNLAVKEGVIEQANYVFSPQNSFPRFQAENSPKFVDEFARDIRFIALYVTPAQDLKTGTTPDGLAAYSTKGLISYHKALMDYYAKNFKSTKGPQDDKYAYFCLNGGTCSAVIKIEKAPQVFANWRELPVPSDPKQHFLSGRALVYYMEKASKDGQFATKRVFEIGSIVRQPEI